MYFLKHNFTRSFYIICLLFAFSACGDDDGPPTDQELVFERLSGDWSVETANGMVILDGTDVSTNYPGFSLSFADGTYTTSNAGDLFQASGTWQFIDEEARMLLLDSGEEVTIIDLTETRFEFSFFSNGTGSSAAGIGGNYTIVLEK